MAVSIYGTKVPEPRTGHKHESTWDYHCSCQLTYFNESVKQKIDFFLLKRLSGKNIDLGGGWYLPYPDSVVVDISSVGLEYNLAKEKLQFNLDKIADGKKLPFADQTFDSATMISVWQYLENPFAVIGELERILKPGAEVYIINGQNAYFEETKKSSAKSSEIEGLLKKKGYDTLIENIPVSTAEINEFKSVCIAMPEMDLFGNLQSRIGNKKNRIEKNKQLCKDQSEFLEEYSRHELMARLSYLRDIEEYPITKYSQEYLAKIEEFSREYNKITRRIPLIFTEYEIEPQVFMLTPEKNDLWSTAYFCWENPLEKEQLQAKEKEECQIREKFRHNVTCCEYINYFNQNTISELLEYCTNFELIPGTVFKSIYYPDGNENELDRFVKFIASIPLNSFTRDIQEKMRTALGHVEGLDEKIRLEKSRGYNQVTLQDKQRRSIQNLINTKKQILEKGIPVVETRKLDYKKYIPYLKKLIH